MSLADEIINRTFHEDRPAEELYPPYIDENGVTHTLWHDEYGTAIYVKDPSNPQEVINDPNYWAIRMRDVNFREYKHGRQGLLHRRKNDLYVGNEKIKLNDYNLMRLCKPQFNIPARIKPQVWDIVRRYVPVFSKDKILVNSNTAVNIKSGGVEHSKKPFLGVTKPTLDKPIREEE